MRMLGKASRGTKGGKMERILTEFPCLPGSRIYSLTGPDYQQNQAEPDSRICKNGFEIFSELHPALVDDYWHRFQI